MADVDIDALIRGDTPAPATGFEDSLNFGSELEDDILTTEVPVDPNVIADLLPEEDQVQVVATALESRQRSWTYLKEDIVKGGGMSRSLAVEAIAIKPTFGDNKPLAYYSIHASRTRYKAALEEIEESRQEDLVSYLENVRLRLDRLQSASMVLDQNSKDNWTKLTEDFASFGTDFSDAVKLIKVKSQPWSDVELAKKAGEGNDYYDKELDRAFVCPAGFLTSLVDKGQYFTIAQHFPDFLDLIVAYLNAWEASVENYIEALEAEPAELPPFTAPEKLVIALPDTSSAAHDELAGRLRQEHENADLYESNRDTPLTIDSYLFAVSAAVQYCGVKDTADRFITILSKIEEHRQTVDRLIQKAKTFDKFDERLTPFVDTMTKLSNELFEVYTSVTSTLEAMAKYYAALRRDVFKIVGLTLLVVETKNEEVEQMTDPALQDREPYLASWQDQRMKLRAAPVARYESEDLM